MFTGLSTHPGNPELPFAKDTGGAVQKGWVHQRRFTDGIVLVSPQNTPGPDTDLLLVAILRTTYYSEEMAKNADAAGLRRANDPPLLILTSLAGGPKHGYALSKDIEEFAGAALSPGALYGAITRLEERGLIEPLAEVDRRRPYRITAAGSAALTEAVRGMSRVADVGSARLGLVRGEFA